MIGAVAERPALAPGRWNDILYRMALPLPDPLSVAAGAGARLLLAAALAALLWAGAFWAMG